MDATETTISDFLYENNLIYIVDDNNPENRRSIDLFLTNFPRSFHNTNTICTGLSDGSNSFKVYICE